MTLALVFGACYTMHKMNWPVIMENKHGETYSTKKINSKKLIKRWSWKSVTLKREHWETEKERSIENSPQSEATSRFYPLRPPTRGLDNQRNPAPSPRQLWISQNLVQYSCALAPVVQGLFSLVMSLLVATLSGLTGQVNLINLGRICYTGHGHLKDRNVTAFSHFQI